MGRKTIDVDYIKDMINNSLSNSTGSKESRESMMTLMESILIKTNNYRGFRYLNNDHVPNDCLPGINDDVDDLFVDTDETRVYYY